MIICEGIEIPQITEVDNACKACKKIYRAYEWNGKLFTTGYCFECSELVAATYRENEEHEMYQKRVKWFQKNCPIEYHEIDRQKLPDSSRYDAVMKWQYGKKGLVLLGNSGMGKTRCSWALIRHWWIEKGKMFEGVTETTLSHKLARYGSNDSVGQWIERLCEVPLLFLDDLGKSVMTERVVSEIFYVIDQRIGKGLPVIYTMQIDSDSLGRKYAARSGPEIAEAILNRLRASCEIVNF